MNLITNSLSNKDDRDAKDNQKINKIYIPMEIVPKENNSFTSENIRVKPSSHVLENI